MYVKGCVSVNQLNFLDDGVYYWISYSCATFSYMTWFTPKFLLMAKYLFFFNIIQQLGALKPMLQITGASSQASRLTHWGRDKMDAISQTTFSSTFSWMKMFEFRLKISLKFVVKGLIDNILALVQIMAWRRPGDKPLSEPMMFSLPTHMCVTRPQWVLTHSPVRVSTSRHSPQIWGIVLFSQLQTR